MRSTNTDARFSSTVGFEGTSTVEGDVGSSLTTGVGANRRFRTNPTGLLGAALITRTGTTSNARTVTFKGNVGMYLQYEGIIFRHTSREVVLQGKADDETFYYTNVTAKDDNVNTLTFKNTTVSNFRGGIGIRKALEGGGFTRKLKSVTLDSASTANVRILGNIVAGEIALNGKTLVLGNGADARGNPIRVFGPAKIATTDTTYSINAPIKTTASSDGQGRGDLNMRDFKFTFEKAIGASGAILANIRVNNATVNMKENVHVASIHLADATLTLAKNLNAGTVNLGDNANLTVSGNLVLGSSGRLNLGANTLKVTGTVATVARLSLTVSGAAGTGAANNGQLDASAGGVTLDANLAINVTVTNPGSITNGQTFTIIKSKTGSLIAATFNDKVVLSNDTARQFAFRLSRNTANTNLIMTTIRVGRTIGTSQKLDAKGEASGIAFGGAYTLTVANGRAIGQTSGVSLDYRRRGRRTGHGQI